MTEVEPVTPERAALMARVRGKDTKPEMIVRRLIYSLGYRYRLHAKDLPGRPDVVFRNKKKAIFVHGCFWHRHPGCRKTTSPKTRQAFWEAKFSANQARDQRAMAALSAIGYDYLVIWECEAANKVKLRETVSNFLG